MSTTAPDYQDEVRHILQGIIGTVIAIYDIDEITYLDVRVDERIYYETPASNWEVVAVCDE
jgi:hypothetical protein